MNTPSTATTETPENHINLVHEDLVQCKNPYGLLKHPKVEQFLRIFNRHRQDQVKHQTTYSGSPVFATPITIDDLKNSQEMLQQAYDFFTRDLLVHGRIQDSVELQSKVNQTFLSVSEQIAAVSKARAELFESFTSETPISIALRKGA